VAETVLITGASGGIGEAFAKIFAARGDRLVLTSRSADNLAKVAASLGDGVRTDIVPVDLSVPSGPAQLLSALETKAIEIDVLINNAGFGTFGPFADSVLEDELSQIQLNVLSLTHLTRALLPGMIRRGRGRVLNVASTAAFQPGPMMAVYYASKAYVLSFSEALTLELRGSGVTVTCLCPGPTMTGFMVRAKMGDPDALTRSRVKSIMMDAETVARKGVEALMKGRRLVIPGFLNRMLAHSTRLGSRGLSAGVVHRMLKAVDATRVRK
jgi:short-subunit dehydrogenase